MITSPPTEVRSIAMSISVFVCPLVYISKTSRPNFTKFSVLIDCGRGSVHIFYIKYSLDWRRVQS